VRAIKVGDTARRSMLVTDEQIDLFARLSGDRNPLHFDEDFARKTKFGRRVVRGGVTAAILDAQVAEDLPGPGSVLMEQHLKYTAPVHPGDTIAAGLVLLKAREDKPVYTVAVRVRREDEVSVLEECVVYVMRTHGRQPVDPGL
jgi:acyl dehydratase